MSVKHITSRDNARYREWLDLAESRQARRSSGCTLLDGEHLLEEAVSAGVCPRYLVVSEASATAEAWRSRLPQVPMVMLTKSLFGNLSPVTTPTGILAVIDIPKPEKAADARFAMLLEDVQDPGNMGSLLRTAAAAGVDSVHLSKGCAEAWSPKALRGGQGGHFRLRIHEGEDLIAVARGFQGRVHAAALRSGRSLFDLDMTGPLAFVFGNEGAGLGEALRNACEPFSIPMAGEVESLNVAAAAAICLFERVRQHGAAKSTP